MQAFGHTVLAWIWLDVACTVLTRDAHLLEAKNQGRISAGAYFYHYELPKIGAWLQVVSERDGLCASLPEAAF
jgi:butyryl-CoA dehydrogenase